MLKLTSYVVFRDYTEGMMHACNTYTLVLKLRKFIKNVLMKHTWHLKVMLLLELAFCLDHIIRKKNKINKKKK